MVNTTYNRKKHIIRKTVTEDVIKTSYTVYTDSRLTNPIYTGLCPNFSSSLTVDWSDWMDSLIYEECRRNGVMDMTIMETRISFPEHDLTVLFTDVKETGDYNDRRTISWCPDIIDISGLTQPKQVGIITGGCRGISNLVNNGPNFPDTMSIWPIFYFHAEGSYTDNGNVIEFETDDCTLDLSHVPDFRLYDKPISYYRTFEQYDKDGHDEYTDADYENIRERVFMNIDYGYWWNESTRHSYDNVYARFEINAPGDTTFWLNMNEMAALSDMTLPSVSPLDVWTFGSRTDVTNVLGHDPDFFHIRTTEENIRNSYDYLLELFYQIINIDGMLERYGLDSLTLTPRGYGFKTSILYNMSNNMRKGFGLFSEEISPCVSIESRTCQNANLVLVDSGFVTSDYPGFRFDNSEGVVTTTTTITHTAKDVVIPLLVKSGMLYGKTIDNFTKDTYMDRWNDNHNSDMSNRYEIECYVDPEWLNIGTGRDMLYSKVMTAMQNALECYITLGDDVSISGIDRSASYVYNDYDHVIRGHVKDVESVETTSSYSSERRNPSIKITFEVYK